MANNNQDARLCSTHFKVGDNIKLKFSNKDVHYIQLCSETQALELEKDIQNRQIAYHIVEDDYGNEEMYLNFGELVSACVYTHTDM